jgi:[ribosomal protein S5]-alanine N-acetyltransferase
VFARVFVQLKDRLLELARPPEPDLTELRTARLLLRDFRDADQAAIHAYRKDRAVLQYLARVEPYGWDEIRLLILEARHQTRCRDRTDYELAIELADTGEVIGEIGLGLLVLDGAQGADAATLGFILHRDHWGRGYATEAAQAMVRFAFRDLNLDTVYAGCTPGNGASRRVIQKLGLGFEGCDPTFPGAPCGVAAEVYALPREEWLRRQGIARVRPRAKAAP